ncbi:uncharacterized protein LOC143240860 isoform X2 [Tachypleus tridentatus]|uniref:uncharacterized protein LOC143240860 isoform X2 n=1 Tax=Tachypleus tridentatus TaxID=6853 RepID=UPI003FD047FE
MKLMIASRIKQQKSKVERKKMADDEQRNLKQEIEFLSRLIQNHTKSSTMPCNPSTDVRCNEQRVKNWIIPGNSKCIHRKLNSNLSSYYHKKEHRYLPYPYRTVNLKADHGTSCNRSLRSSEIIAKSRFKLVRPPSSSVASLAPITIQRHKLASETKVKEQSTVPSLLVSNNSTSVAEKASKMSLINSNSVLSSAYVVKKEYQEAKSQAEPSFMIRSPMLQRKHHLASVINDYNRNTSVPVMKTLTFRKDSCLTDVKDITKCHRRSTALSKSGKAPSTIMTKSVCKKTNSIKTQLKNTMLVKDKSSYDDPKDLRCFSNLLQTAVSSKENHFLNEKFHKDTKQEYYPNLLSSLNRKRAKQFKASRTFVKQPVTNRASVVQLNTSRERVTQTRLIRRYKLSDKTTKLVRTPLIKIVKSKYKVINKKVQQGKTSFQNRKMLAPVEKSKCDYKPAVRSKKNKLHLTGGSTWNWNKNSFTYRNWTCQAHHHILKPASKHVSKKRNVFLRNKFIRKPDYQQISRKNHTKMVIIGGLMYRASNMKLSMAVKPNENKKLGHKTYKLPQRGKHSKPQVQVVIVRGVRYQMDPSGRTLQKISNMNSEDKAWTKESSSSVLKRIDLGRATYVQTKPGVLTKTGFCEARTFASQAVSRSIKCVLEASQKKTKRKTNQYCMFFNRFGKCHKRNTCPYIHDPEKVAVCTRFLRGTCKVVDCLFSHQISPDKMSVCSFFLQGRCNHDKCPYRHVNVNPNAEICRDFLKGYCPARDQCKKQHILSCPEFKKTGQCLKGSSCLLSHPVKSNVKSTWPSIPQKEEMPMLIQVEKEIKHCQESISESKNSVKETEDEGIHPPSKLPSLPSYISLEDHSKKEAPGSVQETKAGKGELSLQIRPNFLVRFTPALKHK